MSAMNCYAGQQPPYASAILVELFKTVDNISTVKVLYKNDSTTDLHPLIPFG